MSNTPGTAGGPGGRDRTLAVKNRKNGRKRLNDGNNNGQATHGARKLPGPINATTYVGGKFIYYCFGSFFTCIDRSGLLTNFCFKFGFRKYPKSLSRLLV